MICVMDEEKSRQEHREKRGMLVSDCSLRRRPLRDHYVENVFEIVDGRLFTYVGSTSYRNRSPIWGLRALSMTRSTEWPGRSLNFCSNSTKAISRAGRRT